MKLQFLTFVALLIPYFGFSQSKFVKAYGGTGDDQATSVLETSNGDYVFTGSTASYGSGDKDLFISRVTKNGNQVWFKTYGGTDTDDGEYIMECSDGGFLAVGSTESYGAGNKDVFLVKTDANGNHEWDKFVGGSRLERGFHALEDSNGDFIITASSKTTQNSYVDVYKFKINGTTRVIAWQKEFGGAFNEGLGTSVDVSGSDYIVSGNTGNVSAVGTHGGFLASVSESTGNNNWVKAYGNTNDERFFSVINGGTNELVTVGTTTSHGSGNDILFVRTNASGSILAQRRIYTSGNEQAYCVFKDGDDYVIGAYTTSNTDRDILLIGVDEDGIVQWSKAFGGTADDDVINKATCVMKTSDGYYLISGRTKSIGSGGYDMVLIKTDTSSSDTCFVRNVTLSDASITLTTNNWNPTDRTNTYAADSTVLTTTDTPDVYDRKCYETYFTKVLGDSLVDDVATAVIQLDNGKYYITGYTESKGKGGEDVFLMRMDEDGVVDFFNTYGDTYDERGNNLYLSDDGNYLYIVGETNSAGAGNFDFYVIKTDLDGTRVWDRTFGGNDRERAYSFLETTNELLVLGHSQSQNTGNDHNDFYLSRINKNTLTNDKTKYWGDDLNEGVSNIIDATSTDYFVCGNTGNFPTAGNHSASISKVKKTDLDVLWNRHYGTSANEERFYFIKKDADGDFLAVGETDQTSGNGIDFFVVNVDDAGVVQWSRRLGFGNDDRATYVISDDNNTNTIIGNGEIGSTSTHNDIVVVNVDEDGEENWSRRIGGTGDETVQTKAKSILKTKDGGYIIVGATSSFGNGNPTGTSNRNIYIVKTDEDFSAECYINDTTLDSASLTTTGTAYTLDSGSVTPSIDSVDLDQKDTLDCEKICPSDQGPVPFEDETTSIDKQLEGDADFTMYPNPTNGNVTIQASEPIKWIVVRDINGRILANFDNINHQKTNIDLAHLRPGTYLISVQTESVIARSLLTKE